MIYLLIMSCARDQANGANDACRNTFLKAWPDIPYKFVVGGVPATRDDELSVDAPDDYGALQLKQRAAYNWVQHMASHVFVSFTDTYIYTPRLLTCGYQNHDYLGLQCRTGEDHLGGGPGYWLSRKAIRVILAAKPIEYWQGDQADYDHLIKAGIKPTDDRRFGDTITRHLSQSTGVYDPLWMYAVHKEMTRE